MAVPSSIVRAIRSLAPALDFYALELKCLLLLPPAMLARPFLKKRLGAEGIWIIGENFGECLQDNGYCFFRYCHETRTRPEAYFLARKAAVMADPYLASNRNVLVYGSLRHLCHLLAAEVFIYSHTHRDILFHRLFPLVARGRRIVFLQHGITGFKRLDAHYHAYRNEPDILVAVSDFEKSIICARAGVDEHRIRVTGFARHDRLAGAAARGGRQQIAYLPTFRDWLDTAGFAWSAFYTQVSAFLADPSLAGLLEKEDTILKFYLHKNMKEYLSFFAAGSERIRLIEFGRESVQRLVRESRLLVTDYSSISWDFYYLQKPVIFYQFDLDEYLAKRGSYLDMNRELFGDRAESRAALIEMIASCIRGGFREKEQYRAARSRYFRYSDASNCQRIRQEILGLRAPSISGEDPRHG